ncbi:MAG TPA: Rho termination factor N-terminal domain-containing protein [Solirubrobacteraceae bacterium]|jgi:transcription termination factor Rho|nr:Rho termination factor N-terminal domain-containing protein [Solirubrobacteraceae bacterium]
MSVVDRGALEASPLADLHAIASELSIDGYRRLRRPELIEAILDRQEGDNGAAAAQTPAAEPEAKKKDVEAKEDASEAEEEQEAPAPRRRRGRRGGRGRSTAREEAETTSEEAETAGEEAETPRMEVESPRAEIVSRREEAEAEAEPETEPGDELVEGVVELLANGSGFIRVDPPDPSDDDVYISSAQVKRCELVSGDRVAGPKRAPRRSERFASLIRIETINGRPAAELADSVRFDDLPATFPTERLKVGSEDPTLKAIEWLTPFGKGSRVTIVGGARAGKTEALRRLVAAMGQRDELSVSVVLAGVRPEEISEWNGGPVPPSAAVSFAASEDARNGAVEPAIDQARRLAARGADAVVFIDTLDGCAPQLARKALGAARNIVEGGSVTIIATATEPVGGETTVISLDASLTAAGRFPALDLVASGTMRPELLVGEAGAEAIARTRAEAEDG